MLSWFKIKLRINPPGTKLFDIKKAPNGGGLFFYPSALVKFPIFEQKIDIPIRYFGFNLEEPQRGHIDL